VRIVIAGAGAIGGYIGARLATVGADVVLFARGRICTRCRSAACV
jgi:ketopantoate reductase